MAHDLNPTVVYPPTQTSDACDTYFGITYKDPYRPLEDTQDANIQAWYKSQAELTDKVLSAIAGRDVLVEEWSALDKLTPAEYSSITCNGGRVFYKKALGGENVGRLYYREGWDGDETLLFDPGNTSSGVTTTIQFFFTSWDGKYVVIALSSRGAEYSELRILNVDRRTLLPESISPSLFAVGWLPDSSGFFYDIGKVNDLTSLEIELNRKTRLHKLGSDVSADIDFFSNESYPELGIAPEEFALAYIDKFAPEYVLGMPCHVQAEMRIYYAPAADMTGDRISWKVLCSRSDKLVRGIVFNDEDVYAVTHADAPHYRVTRTKLREPDWNRAETVVPETTDSIVSITRSKSYLFIIYSNGIVCRVVKHNFSSRQSNEVVLPASGTVTVICPDSHSDHCLVLITSWTSPQAIYDFDADSDTFSIAHFDTNVSYPGFDNLVSEELEVPGDDGVMIPLSVVYRKDIPMDGSNSCILAGYGAYGMSYSPHFSIMHSPLTRGVVIAFAHVRGGGEMGEEWRKAGFKTTKPNTWKDLISCAEYLVRNGYTRPDKLGITGASAGGIMISRAVTERPDLFAAAVCNVGVANAGRFEFAANGPANVPEFGSVNDPVECRALYEMDGVRHVDDGVKYPAVLGVAGWNDPRVPPWQTAKYVAALQSKSRSGKPALMMVNYDSGHFTEEKVVTFRNFANQTAFLLWQTGHKDFQPAGMPTRSE